MIEKNIESIQILCFLLTLITWVLVMNVLRRNTDYCDRYHFRGTGLRPQKDGNMRGTKQN